MLHENSSEEDVKRWKQEIMIAAGYGKQLYAVISPGSEDVSYVLKVFLKGRYDHHFRRFEDAWGEFKELKGE